MHLLLNHWTYQLQTSQVHRSHYVEGSELHLCDLDPKVKVIGKKAGICDGVPSTAALVIAPDKAAYCVFTQFRGPENAIKFISVRTKTQ